MFAIVPPEFDIVVPPRMMRIERQSLFRQSQPSVPIPRISCQISHQRLGVAIERVERHGPLGGLTKALEIFLEKARLRKTVVSNLAGRVERKSFGRGRGSAAEGIRAGVKAVRVLYQIHQRERSPRVGIVRGLLDRTLQAGADDGMLLRRNMLPEAELSKHGFIGRGMFTRL